MEYCSVNKAKVDALTAQIKELDAQIDTLRKQIKELRDEKEKYNELKGKLSSAISSLNSYKGKISAFGNACSYVKIPYAVDNGVAASGCAQIDVMTARIEEIIGQIPAIKIKIDTEILGKEKEIIECIVKQAACKSQRDSIPERCGTCYDCTKVSEVVEESVTKKSGTNESSTIIKTTSGTGSSRTRISGMIQD